MYSLSTEQLCNLAIKEYEMYREMDTLCSVTLTDKDWKMFALTMRCLFFIQYIKGSSKELTIDKVTEINTLADEWLELYVSKNLNRYLPYWWDNQFEQIFVVLCKSLKMREFKVALQILVDFVALMLETLSW
jgi:hypothetical protein